MDDAGTLLVLDYPGRRDEAPVRALDLEAAGYQVRYLLAGGKPRELTGAAYAERLLAGHDGVPVRAVLAYCMAAPLAQHVAAMVRTGPPVPLLLFDGEPSSEEAVRDQFRVALSQVGRADRAAAARVAADRALAAAEIAGAPARVVAFMRGQLAAALRAALVEDGAEEDELDEAEDGELVEFYLDWLVHLVAAHNAGWPEWGGLVLNVWSRHHPYRRPWPGAAGSWWTRVDEPRPVLLSQAETRARALAALVDPSRPPPGWEPCTGGPPDAAALAAATVPRKDH